MVSIKDCADVEFFDLATKEKVNLEPVDVTVHHTVNREGESDMFVVTGGANYNHPRKAILEQIASFEKIHQQSTLFDNLDEDKLSRHGEGVSLKLAELREESSSIISDEVLLSLTVQQTLSYKKLQEKLWYLDINPLNLVAYDSLVSCNLGAVDAVRELQNSLNEYKPQSMKERKKNYRDGLNKLINKGKKW